MKKNLMSSLAMLALLSTPLTAALPPLYEGIREIQAILSDQQLGNFLQPGEVITDIHKTSEGYLISTNKSRVPAEVVYEPNKQPGPAQFHIVFKSPSVK